MKTRRADSIADDLEERIFNGFYSDGDRMDEARLAKQFGVSRTPVREALQRLSRSGLIELIPRRGAFVRQPGPVELLELFEAMAEIEAACGYLAARRITDAALAKLHEANRLCLVAIESQNPDAYYRQNETFHAIIYQQSGNAYLASEARTLHRRLKPFRRKQLSLRGRMLQSMAEHETIVEALEAGRADDAANALRDHVAIQGEKFQNLMATIRNVAE